VSDDGLCADGGGHDKKAGCREVLSEVWAFLDNECDGRQREILRQHLDECSPCLEQYGIEEHLKILLARKCGGDHASAERRPDEVWLSAAAICQSVISSAEVWIGCRCLRR